MLKSIYYYHIYGKYVCGCMYICVYVCTHIVQDFGKFSVLNLKENKNASYKQRHFSILLYGSFLLRMVKCAFVRFTYLKYHTAFHYCNCVVTTKTKQRLQ